MITTPENARLWLILGALSVLSLVVVQASPSAAQQGTVIFNPNRSSADDDGLDGESSPDRVPSSRNVRGYAKYRGDFRDLCEAFERDGRRAIIYPLLDTNAQRDLTCIACRPLFSVFASSCKPQIEKSTKRRSGKRGNADPTPTPSPPPTIAPQRDPSTEVLQQCSLLFQSIADDAYDQDETSLAIKRLVSLLNQQPNLPPGAQDYLRTVASFIAAPFTERLGAISQQESVGGKAGSSSAELKALFD